MNPRDELGGVWRIFLQVVVFRELPWSLWPGEFFSGPDREIALKKIGKLQDVA